MWVVLRDKFCTSHAPRKESSEGKSPKPETTLSRAGIPWLGVLGLGDGKLEKYHVKQHHPMKVLATQQGSPLDCRT